MKLNSPLDNRIKDSLSRAVKTLKIGRVDDPEKSAEFLMRFVLGLNKVQLFAVLDCEIKQKDEQKFNSLITRRLKHEPVWYITGRIEFCGIDLAVDENVLIPRPETEFLVEKAAEMLKVKGLSEVTLAKADAKSNAKKPLAILDLGTGSGAIVLALANKLKDQNSRLKTSYCASDLSTEALVIAKKNAQNLGIENVEFRQGNLFEPWEGQKFDLVLANLPYIPHEDMAGLSLDIHHWEPRVALDGGKKGLEIYEKFFSQAGKYLSEEGTIIVEIGYDQGEEVARLVERNLPGAIVTIEKDYADIDRIAIISI